MKDFYIIKNTILLIISFILFRCGSDSSSIIYGINTFPKTLDPDISLGFDENQISSQIYENLISLSDDYKSLEPHLAVRWDVSDNKRAYTFYLRDDVYFHDGTKLSSQSVLKSYKYLKKKKIKSDIYTKIDTVVIIDSLTFQFFLKNPYSIFLNVLASPLSFQIMSENALRQYGDDISRHPVGTGPYKINEWKNNQQIVLEKFNDYWGDQGNINLIIFKYFKNTFKKEKQLEKAVIDILYLPSPYFADRLKMTGFIDYYTLKPWDIWFLGFNNRMYPFNNIRLRKAVLKAIDKSRLVYTLNRGNAIIARGPLSPELYNYEKINPDQYNLKGAKKIVDEFDYRGLKINFAFPKPAFTRLVKIEFLKFELKKIGLSLDIHAADSWQEFNEMVQTDSIHMFYEGGMADIVDDGLNLLYGLFYSSSESNLMGYNEPLIDRWIDEAFLEHNREKRRLLYDKIIRKILNDTPAVFLSHVIPNLAYNTNKIKKLAANPYGVIHFNEMELN